MCVCVCVLTLIIKKKKMVIIIVNGSVKESDSNLDGDVWVGYDRVCLGLIFREQAVATEAMA